MAREIDKLNPLTIKTLTKPGMYHDGRGLFLAVSKAGTQSWIYRYTGIDGKRHDLGLGSVHDRPLAKARELATKHRLSLLDNFIDPVLAKRAAKAEARAAAARNVTFAQVADQYIEAHRADWKSSTEEQNWRARLRDHVFPVIGSLPVGTIDLPLVLKVLEPKWSTMASMGKIRGIIENILAFARVKGLATGDNPARWAGNLSVVLSSRAVAKVEHFEALPYSEIGGFVSELRAIDTVGAKALLFAILTAARRGEILGATWQEIDLERRVWVIPDDRMKMKKEHEHVVPLSDAAVALLEGLPHKGALIFHDMSANAMHRVCTKLRPGVSVHGMRSTFRDWAGDMTGYDRVDVELCLAHAAGDATEQSYRRSTAVDKRRRIMADWSIFCFGDAPSPASTNIYPLRSANS